MTDITSMQKVDLSGKDYAPKYALYRNHSTSEYYRLYPTNKTDITKSILDWIEDDFCLFLIGVYTDNDNNGIYALFTNKRPYL